MRNRAQAIVRKLKEFSGNLRSRLPSERSKQLLILAVILLALPVAVFLVQQAVRYRLRAIAEPVDIFFASDQVALPPNTSLRLMFDAKSNKIGFARIEVSFDNSKVNLTGDIQTTDKIKNVIEKTSRSNANSTGKIVIVLGLMPEDKGNPPSGVFEFAKLPFGVVTSQADQTKLSVIDAGVQIVEMQAFELAFTSKAATLSLNSAPTQTPTPTPTAGPTPTPTPTPTPGGPVPGDVNGDGIVNAVDLGIVIDVYRTSPPADERADLNNDGVINAIDLGILIDNYYR